MAQFKEIMALRLNNRSYSYIAAALGCVRNGDFVAPW